MRYIVLILSCLLSTGVCAQESAIIYLKDGSIIRGEITDTVFNDELQIENIKVRITGGSIFSFSREQIIRIEKVSNSFIDDTTNSPDQINKKILSHKNPGAACVLSLLIAPGIGQLYNEQVGKALCFLGAGALGASMYLSGARKEIASTRFSGHDSEYHDEGKMSMGGFIYFGAWVFSVIDAYDSANKINQSLGISIMPNTVNICYRF